MTEYTSQQKKKWLQQYHALTREIDRTNRRINSALQEIEVLRATARPDLDNAQKLLQDCMTKLGFWADDGQIARLTMQKLWAEVEGIAIEAYTMIEEVEE